MVTAWAAANIASAAELSVRSDREIVGRDGALDATFTAWETVPDIAEVELTLRSGTTISAHIEYANELVAVRSSRRDPSGKERLAAVSAADVIAARTLMKTVGTLTGRAGDALASVLNLVSDAPAGFVFDVDQTRTGAAESRAAAKRGFVSLCTTQNRAAVYDIGNKLYSFTTKVGPCYNQANQCLGRCGRGCQGDGPTNSATVQRFTQDCFNHDVCLLRTDEPNGLGGQCGDEFRLAIDDYLLGTDCGDMDGPWKDNFLRAWTLSQGLGAIASVSGTVKAGSCQYRVQGTHEAAAIKLTATYSGSACCRQFTYTGRMGTCSVATGTWRNACSLSGTFKMSRTGVADSSATAPVGAAPWNK